VTFTIYKHIFNENIQTIELQSSFYAGDMLIDNMNNTRIEPQCNSVTDTSDNLKRITFAHNDCGGKMEQSSDMSTITYVKKVCYFVDCFRNVSQQQHV
jgi:hypothetical protein